VTEKDIVERESKQSLEKETKRRRKIRDGKKHILGIKRKWREGE
jgi:hypothetical protein